MCSGYLSLFVYFVLFHKQVLGSCQQNCAVCSKNDNLQSCDECNYSYWLAKNGYCYHCPDNCEQCTSTSQCTKCKPEFWDIWPDMTCGSTCSKTCTARGCNDTTGHCFECYPGFYGPICDRNCDLCINKLCTHQKCEKGCIDGYYENTDTGFECKQCIKNCLSCVSKTNCTQCEKGYYLFSYENSENRFCSPCYPPCEECINYRECVCNSGKYGPTCNKDCNISNCKRCIEVDSAVKCTECINGYIFINGSCIPETSLCSQYCSYGCDINQNCLGGCQNGWTGQKCTERCAEQCGQCDQNDGKDCKICKGDFYTAACTLPCSIHCSTLPGLPRCDINTGTCLNGCDKGYWDVKCEKSCYEGCNSESCSQSDGFCETCNRTHYGYACQSKCSEHCVNNDSSSAVCYKSNGTCVHGCKDGYRGKACKNELTVSTMMSSSTDIVINTEKVGGQYDKNDQSDSFVKIFFLGMLTGVGVCLLSLVAFVAVRRIRRRRKQPNESQIVREERPYVNTAVTMQAVSSSVAECSSENVRSNKTSDETARSVYDSLDGDRRDDRHLYSGLKRQTYHHSTSYANL